MSPAIIFTSINTAKAVAAYFGLIESVGGNVQKLLHQAFKSAIQNLKYAQSSSGQNRVDYIRTAKDRFIDAISVEENENLVSSLVGLAMCQYLLNDFNNVQITMSRIKNVELTLAAKTKAAGSGYLKGGLRIFGAFNAIDQVNKRIDQFENYKNLALATK